jgi:hypothetical protein
MDTFFLVLLVGFGGLMLMALIGLGHHSHHGAHGHAPSGAHGHAAHHHGASLPTVKGGPSHSHAPASAHGAAFALLTLTSPRIIFTLLMGFGAAGMVLRPLADNPVLRFTLAVVGAAGLEILVARPLWGFLFRFASNPARTLDSAVCEEGCAVTNFDSTGHGLISLQLDGQHMQVLGSLSPEDRLSGQRVRAGERLFICAVDARRNRCTVSRLQ